MYNVKNALHRYHQLNKPQSLHQNQAVLGFC